MATDDKGFTSMDEKMRKKATEMSDKTKSSDTNPSKKTGKKDIDYPGTTS